MIRSILVALIIVLFGGVGVMTARAETPDEWITLGAVSMAASALSFPSESGLGSMRCSD